MVEKLKQKPEKIPKNKIPIGVFERDTKILEKQILEIKMILQKKFLEQELDLKNNWSKGILQDFSLLYITILL